MRRLAEIETVLDGLTNVALTRKLGVFKLSLIQWWFLRIKLSLQLQVSKLASRNCDDEIK